MDPLNVIALLEQQGLCPPETLTIAITDACNLHCAHCWVAAGFTGPPARVATSAARHVIEAFAALGGTAVRLTGGEPLLHPDWLELVEIAAAAGLKVLLQTNGMLFGADNMQALQALDPADLTLQISLDGATAAAHDRVRGAGAYEQTLQGIRRLIASGFGPDVALFFTEMRHNLHELPALLRLAEQLGVGSVSSGSLVVCGRAREEQCIAPPDPEQYPLLLQRYAEDSQFRQRYARLGRIAALEWCGAEMSRPGCLFVKNPYLTATGRLYPCLLCHAADYSVAEVFAKGFTAALREGLPLWSSLQAISQRRPALIPECQACLLRKSCAGGCMGRAWESFGDFLAAEDRCQQRQAVLRWKEKS
ncbi:MAG: radical SAM protein [Deltaproteobacteria bacterium]|nr:radical SAM protein [Deltaproteobacteria bacterium]